MFNLNFSMSIFIKYLYNIILILKLNINLIVYNKFYFKSIKTKTT